LSQPILWSWEELAPHFIIENAAGDCITGISLDSRTISPGDLFIALPGVVPPPFHTGIDNPRDGHDFIDHAISAGAAAVMVSQKGDYGVPALVVDDTFDGLWQLARLARQRVTNTCKVIGITGSSGKTTARAFLELAVSGQGKVHASKGSLNNHWGVPLSLARMPGETELGIFEIGTNHAGEILPLATLVRPNICVVLNVVPAHVGNFQSLEALREEKLSISGGLDRDGVLIIPEELDREGHQASSIKTFGQTALCDAELEKIDRLARWHVTVRLSDREYSADLPAMGDHRMMTVLCVLLIVDQLHLDPGLALEQLRSLELPEGRGSVHELGSGIVVIDDSYNANPVSTRYALRQLADMNVKRKIVLLGEMLELGEESDALHLAILPELEGIDGVFTVGSGYRALSERLGDKSWGHFDHIDELRLESLVEQFKAEDVILIKGSNRIFWTSEFSRKLRVALDTA